MTGVAFAPAKGAPPCLSFPHQEQLCLCNMFVIRVIAPTEPLIKSQYCLEVGFGTSDKVFY